MTPSGGFEYLHELSQSWQVHLHLADEERENLHLLNLARDADDSANPGFSHNVRFQVQMIFFSLVS